MSLVAPLCGSLMQPADPRLCLLWVVRNYLGWCILLQVDFCKPYMLERMQHRTIICQRDP